MIPYWAVNSRTTCSTCKREYNVYVEAEEPAPFPPKVEKCIRFVCTDCKAENKIGPNIHWNGPGFTEFADESYIRGELI